MRCGCWGEAAIATDLVAGGLLPTSFSRFQAFFTMAVLDDFRLSNLECKSLAYQYWNKISRVGALAMSSLDVDDFYWELHRLSQSWRYIKKLIWSGFAHDYSRSVLEPEPGELALFCSACPQHTINLPQNWLDVVNQNILMCSVLPKTGKDIIPDIWLGEGGQFMTPLLPYLKYLKERQNSKPTKVLCENQFRVLEQAMLQSKACDIKGIVALACARHGCFILTCVADLPAGEQQKNVDYILQELFWNGNFGEVQHILFMYDIVCQYIVHLAKRLGPDIPEHLTIDQAIGLMHAQTATLTHRAEILNDHMSDINWKKILNMPGFLCHKYQEAIAMHAKATTYHDSMITTLRNEDHTIWDREIERAEVERIKDYKSMDIMKTQDVKQALAMSATDTPTPESPDANEDWIRLSLMIEEQQQVSHSLIVTEYKSPWEEDWKAVEVGRDSIAKQLTILAALQVKAGYVV
ncbi:hypothetical protein DXG01_003425 [Tephrocybe rancida]|nr:hypothetical protein DXG01_003425 [Tephrocybe rancida]